MRADGGPHKNIGSHRSWISPLRASDVVLDDLLSLLNSFSENMSVVFLPQLEIDDGLLQSRVSARALSAQGGGGRARVEPPAAVSLGSPLHHEKCWEEK